MPITAEELEEIRQDLREIRSILNSRAIEVREVADRLNEAFVIIRQANLDTSSIPQNEMQSVIQSIRQALDFATEVRRSRAPDNPGNGGGNGGGNANR